MTKDKHTTVMIFKKFPEGDVIALMPEDSHQDGRGQTLITSYMRIGQHGGASPELIQDLEDASKQERKSLKQELKSLGYKIKEGN